MFFRKLLITGLLGSSLPLISHAQTAPPASTRFYVGVGANMLSNVPLKDNGIVPRLIGPALTAGMQLTPRLAVQAGLSYHWTKESYELQFINTADVKAVIRSNYFLVPVLLRYTVTNPAEQFHFDVAGGATLIHAASRGTYESSGFVDPALDLRDYRNSATRFNLTLGPAVRATLTPSLELTASGLVSMVVGEDYYRFSDRLFLNTSLGINYTFGQR